MSKRAEQKRADLKKDTSMTNGKANGAAENAATNEGEPIPIDFHPEKGDTDGEEAMNGEYEDKKEEKDEKEKAHDNERDEAEEDEEENLQDPPPRQPTYLEQLEVRLKESQDQLKEYIAAYKKVKEETEGFKKRLQRETTKELDGLRGQLVADLLEVLDNLDRSIQGAEKATSVDGLLQGVRMVRNQFMDKLQGLGLESIDPLGEEFNPNEAEALAVLPTDDPEEDNKVAQVFTLGYRMNDRIIRPARVQVSRLKDEI